MHVEWQSARGLGQHGYSEGTRTAALTTVRPIEEYLASLSLMLRRRCNACRASAGAGWRAAIVLCDTCCDHVEEVGADLDAAARDFALAGWPPLRAQQLAVEQLLPPDILSALLAPGLPAGSTPAVDLGRAGWIAAAILPVVANIWLISWGALMPVLLILAAAAGRYASGPAGAVAGVAAVLVVTWTLLRVSDAAASRVGA